MASGFRHWGRIGRFGLLLAALAAIRCVAGVESDRDRMSLRAPAPAAGENARSSRLESREMMHQGQRRSYSLFVPPQLDSAEPAPLVLVFHGGHGRGDRLARRIGMNAIARERGFVVAYPDAAGDGHWNDGRTSTRSAVDDVSFALALIEHIGSRQAVDDKRVYSTGFSNGGSFTARLACELSDRIAAFAQVGSTMSVELRAMCAPGRAVPVMIVNGTSDPLVPWEGGRLRQSRQLGKGGEVISAADAIAFWSGNNECDTTPEVARLEDRDPDDGTTVERSWYRQCRDQTEVILIAVDGGGHTWPGSPERPRLKRTVGRTSRDISASEMIWDFFSRHSLR